MKRWLVISGKGGTGKTCVTGSLAVLAEKPVLADCDVDAADLHMLSRPEHLETHEFYAGIIASINPDKCTGCGLCQELCRYNAIESVTYQGRDIMKVNEIACEGCDVCHRFCPENAVETESNHCGTWYLSNSRLGPMVHARLIPGAENSGKLVSLVRQKADEQAGNMQRELVLIDGPPGVGCPVISSITGVDLAILVTEPSPSGRHDLLRVLELADHFDVPAEVIINKYDLNEEFSRTLEQELKAKDVAVAGKIRFDPRVYNALLEGKTIAEFCDGGAAEDIKAIWGILKKNHL